MDEVILPSLNMCLNESNVTARNLSLRQQQQEQLQCEQLIQVFEQVMQKSDEAQYQRDIITYYLMGIGGMTVCCLGLIGNMVALIVLTHKSMRSSTYSYLSALCVCDSLFLLFTVIILVKDLNKPVMGEQKWPWDDGFYPYLFPYVHPAAFTFQVTSVWLTLAFTVDRYIMICHPFKAEPYCTINRARIVIITLYIGSILFNIPKFFEYKTVAITVPFSNVTKIGCDLTSLGKSNLFRLLYHWWLYLTCVCGLPFLTLAILNGFLMHAVILSRKKGKEINAAEKKRMDTTVMLIGVVVVFFICQMPALVSRVIWASEDNPATHKKIHLYTLNEMGTFLIILNSAINIVPYYFFGKKFRRQFWLIFCQCLLRYERFRAITHNTTLTIYENNRRMSNGSVLTAHHGNQLETRFRDGRSNSTKSTSFLVPTELTVHRASDTSSATRCPSNSAEALLKSDVRTADKPADPATSQLMESKDQT